MLTIPQLAARGILPGRAIRRLVDEGRIPTVEIGNRRYINFSVFEQFLVGRE
jgi:excisionase family DNA binding protein